MVRAKNLLLNFLGSVLLAFGVCAFVEPFGLVVGGATGISLIIHRLFGVNVSTVSFIINMGVLIPGYLLGGRKLVLGSLFSSLVFPVALAVFEKFPFLTTLVDSTMLACICGGVICGTGIGLVIRSGGSTGGVDIPVILISKLIHVPVNTVMNATDSCIMLIQLPFSLVENVIYGLIYTFIMTNALERVLTLGGDRFKISIISEQHGEIARSLSAHDFGVTKIYAEGGYTGTPINKLECVTISQRYRRALKLIEEVDPTAFITVEKVRDVRGRGFTMEREWIDMGYENAWE